MIWDGEGFWRTVGGAVLIATGAACHINTFAFAASAMIQIGQASIAGNLTFKSTVVYYFFNI